MIITLETLVNAGLSIGNNGDLKTLVNVLLRRHRLAVEANETENFETVQGIINKVEDRRRKLEAQKIERDAERAQRENESIKPRLATAKDLDKSRTRVQTTFRRGVKGKLRGDVRAEGKALSCKSSGSKERVKPSAKAPDGWNTTSQGAGNVIGCKELKERKL